MQSIVLLPTYNEASNLEPLLDRILHVGDFQVLVIDDNSPDGTGQLAEQIKLRYPNRVDVLHRREKLGLASAYREGFEYALARGFSYIFQMDADFSHNPSDLPRLAAALDAGTDLVIGSRYVCGGQTPGWPRSRRILSRVGSMYAHALLGLDVRDLTGGFKGIRREVIEALDFRCFKAHGYAFLLETTYQCYRKGCRITEVLVTFVNRHGGQSKMSRDIVFEAFWTVLKLRVG